MVAQIALRFCLAVGLALCLVCHAVAQGALIFRQVRQTPHGPSSGAPVTTIAHKTIAFGPTSMIVDKENSAERMQNRCSLTVAVAPLPTVMRVGQRYPVKIEVELVIRPPKVPTTNWQFVKDEVKAGFSTFYPSSVEIRPDDDGIYSGPGKKTWEGTIAITGHERTSFEVWVSWTADRGVFWQGSIAFDYAPDTGPSDEKLPVIFIPGVCGSQLDDARGAGWQLWPLKYSPTADRRDLALRPDGTPVAPIKVNGVIESALGNDFYGKFLANLAEWGYRKGDYLETFPYDWRLDNRSHAAALDALVNTVRARTGKPKVILLTHSMGGLVARHYLTHGGNSKVAKHIALSAPHLGSAKVFYAYLMGYTFGNDSVNPNLMKALFPNLPAGYQLMPVNPFILDIVTWRDWTLDETWSLGYRGVELTNPNIVTSDEWTISQDWPWRFNRTMATGAAEFHQGIGTRPADGVPTFSIMGYGLATVARYHAYRPSKPGAVRRPDGATFNLAPEFEMGDETVPFSSLEGLQGDAKFYLKSLPDDSAEHTAILKSPRALTLVRGILEGKISGPSDVTEFPVARPSDEEIAPTTDGPFVFTIRCPADLHVWSADGKHLGLTDRRTVERGIADGSFLVGDEEQHAAILRPNGAYRIRVVSRGSGTFTLTMSLGNGKNRRAVRYVDVPILKGTVAEFAVPSAAQGLASPPSMTVRTADGITTVQPTLGDEISSSTPPPPVVTDAGPKPASTVVCSSNPGWVRTLLYHQLTKLGRDDALEVYNGQEPRISADGRYVVYTLRPVPGDPKRLSRLSVIGTDGAGARVVDLVPEAPIVDISSDGRTVVSAGTGQLRLIRVGEGAKVLMENPNLGTVRLSADGATVFYCQTHDYVDPSTRERLERGVWAIRADGTGRRKVVGAAAVAQMLGISASQLGTFYSDSRGSSLDVSNDGTRVVLLANGRGTASKGQVLTVYGDGTNLHKVGDSTDGISSVGISADGRRVAWVSREVSPVRNEGWTSLFDGTDKRKLSDRPDGGRSVSLTRDGGWVLFGMEAVLYRTDRAERVLVAPIGVTGGQRFVEERLHALTMSDDGTRLTYAMDSGPEYDLALIDLAATAQGGAPVITEIAVTPPDVTPEPTRRVTVAARISAPTEIVGGIARAIFLIQGVWDTSLWGGGMTDDARATGDAKPGDGVFTEAIAPSRSAPAGMRQVRVKAETIGQDGRRHATVVEVDTARVRP